MAKLAAVRFLGTFSGLVALGAGIAAILIRWVESIDVAGLASDATAIGLGSVASLLGTVRTISDFLPGAGLALVLLPILLLFVGLLYWFLRSGKIVDARIRHEMFELRRKFDNNELEWLPPDELMHVARRGASAPIGVISYCLF